MDENRESSGPALAKAIGAVTFGDACFDSRSGELQRNGSVVRLTPKAIALLAALLERAPGLATKEELLTRVWDGKAVGDEALTSCIQELRRALNDDSRRPRYIETLHRRGYRLIAPLGRPEASAPPGATVGKPSLAVLPFANLSGDAEQEYFADGLVDDIITALSGFKSLFVIARNSSFTYKGKAVDVKQIGRELGVRYVLEGSVRKAGPRVRVTGQLVDCETGSYLWAHRFDSSLEDIFDLQDQMTANVVGAVAPNLDKAEMDRAQRRLVDNPDAYDCFLLGKAQLHLATPQSLNEALRLFHRAIALDANFATAYGLATRCYSIARVQGWSLAGPPAEVEVRRLASRVSEIGCDDAVALCWAGIGLAWVCHDTTGGAELLDHALSINENIASCWRNRGLVSVYQGQHEEALEQIGRALQLSPLEPENYRSETFMAWALIFLGRHDEAVKWARKALGHDPNWMQALRASAVASALAGNIDEARKFMALTRELDPKASISRIKKILPYERPLDRERILEGLRLAGLPE